MSCGKGQLGLIGLQAFAGACLAKTDHHKQVSTVFQSFGCTRTQQNLGDTTVKVFSVPYIAFLCGGERPIKPNCQLFRVQALKKRVARALSITNSGAFRESASTLFDLDHALDSRLGVPLCLHATSSSPNGRTSANTPDHPCSRQPTAGYRGDIRRGSTVYPESCQELHSSAASSRRRARNIRATEKGQVQAHRKAAIPRRFIQVSLLEPQFA